MTPVLLDTGVIVALLDRDERHHRACVRAVREAPGPLVTCEAVIAESCYLLRAWPKAVSAVLENVERGVFQVPFRLTGACSAVRALLTKYAQVPMALADACLVVLAAELATPLVLTLDSDFATYRWGRSRAFENLVTLSRR